MCGVSNIAGTTHDQSIREQLIAGAYRHILANVWKQWTADINLVLKDTTDLAYLRT